MCVKCSYVANTVFDEVFAIRWCACKLHVHWQLNMRATSPLRVHEVGSCEYRAGTRSKIRALLKGFSTQSCFRGDVCRWLLVSPDSHSLRANFWLTKSLALNHLSLLVNSWYEVASILERIYWERSVSLYCQSQVSWRHGVCRTIRQAFADSFATVDTELLLTLLLQSLNYSLGESIKVEFCRNKSLDVTILKF